MGIADGEIDRLLRTKWHSPQALAEELYQILSQKDIAISTTKPLTLSPQGDDPAIRIVRNPTSDAPPITMAQPNPLLPGTFVTTAFTPLQYTGSGGFNPLAINGISTTDPALIPIPQTGAAGASTVGTVPPTPSPGGGSPPTPPPPPAAGCCCVCPPPTTPPVGGGTPGGNPGGTPSGSPNLLTGTATVTLLAGMNNGTYSSFNGTVVWDRRFGHDHYDDHEVFLIHLRPELDNFSNGGGAANNYRLQLGRVVKVRFLLANDPYYFGRYGTATFFTNDILCDSASGGEIY
jgi:hypothetical protein